MAVIFPIVPLNSLKATSVGGLSLVLMSPVGADAAEFPWPFITRANESDPHQELVDLMK